MNGRKGNASVAATTKALSVKNQAINQGVNMTNSTEVTASSTTATPDLAIVEGQITTTSQQIAEHFGKRHDTVLRSIRNLECSDEYRLHNFAESSYLNEQGKSQPCFTMTRDGFVFLAMGFTGKEAAHWKEAYITAFNKMEAQLLAQAAKAQPVQASLDYDRISPAQAQDLKQIVQAIVDAGIQNYAETWARLQRKFKVHSYLALRPDQYEAARAYLIAKLPNGYAGDEVQEALPELGVNLFAKQAMQHAQANAVSYMRQWREQQAQAKGDAVAVGKIPSEVLAGLVAEQLTQQRWLVGYDYSLGGLLAQPVAKEEFVCNWAQLARGIACGDRQATTAELVDLASACNQQLVQRMGNPALVLAV